MKFRFSVGHFDASFWWVFVVVCWLPGSQALLWDGMELIFEIFAATLFRPINLTATAPKKNIVSNCIFFFLFSCISFEHDLWNTKKRISLKESCKDHRPTTLSLFYNTEPENRSRELYRRNTDDWRGWLYNLLQSTPISIRSPQKVRGNKVITNLVADGS